MYQVRAQDIRKHTSRIKDASPTAISRSPTPSPLSFLPSFFFLHSAPVALDSHPEHRCKTTNLARVPATCVPQYHNTHYIASQLALEYRPVCTPASLCRWLTTSRKSKNPRPKKPCSLLQCGTFTAWLGGIPTHPPTRHSVKTGIIENDARKSKLSSFGLRGKNKRILSQPSVETSKKEKCNGAYSERQLQRPSGILNCSCFTVHVRPRQWHRPSTTKTRQGESRSLFSNYLSNRWAMEAVGYRSPILLCPYEPFSRALPYDASNLTLPVPYQCYAIYMAISNQTKDPPPLHPK